LPAVMKPFFESSVAPPAPSVLRPQVVTEPTLFPATKQPPVKKKRQRLSLSSKEKLAFKVPPMPDYGIRPEAAGGDWVAVPLKAASVANLLLFILNSANGRPLSSTDLEFGLAEYREKSGSSTISMTLKKLVEEKYIAGDSRGWQLIRDVGGIISGDRLWVPLNQLRSTDKAAVRREVILSALRLNGTMPNFVIARCLQECEWLTVPVSPYTVKSDMRIMFKEGFVCKDGLQWRLKAA